MKVNYEAVLADLMRKKEAAETAINAIQRLLSYSSQDDDEGVDGEGESQEEDDSGNEEEQEEDEEEEEQETPAANSIPLRVIELLSQYPGRSADAKVIASRIGGNVNLKTLRGALSRMTSDRKLERVGRGRYRFVPPQSESSESSEPPNPPTT